MKNYIKGFIKPLIITCIIGIICFSGGSAITNLTKDVFFKPDKKETSEVTVVNKNTTVENNTDCVELNNDNLTQSETNIPEYITYNILKGDTISKISIKFYGVYNTYIDNELLMCNNIEADQYIYIGQELKIPTKIGDFEIINTYLENSNTDDQSNIVTTTHKTDDDLAIQIAAEYLDSNYETNKLIIDAVRRTTSTMYTNVPFELAMAVISKESRFVPYAISTDGTCYGLMQIHAINHPRLSVEIGKGDYYNNIGPNIFLEIDTNVMAGCNLLSSLIVKHGNDYNSILMEYNGGAGYLRRMNNNGIYSTEYSTSIIDRMDSYR